MIQELQEFSDDYSLVMVARRIDKLIAIGKDYKTNLMHLKEKKDTLDKQVIQLREQIKIQKTELNRFQTYSEEQLARFSQAERQ